MSDSGSVESYARLFRSSVASLYGRRPDPGDAARKRGRESVSALIDAARWCDARTDPGESWAGGEAWLAQWEERKAASVCAHCGCKLSPSVRAARTGRRRVCASCCWRLGHCASCGAPIIVGRSATGAPLCSTCVPF